MLKYYPREGDTLAFSLADRSRFPTLKERYTTSRPAYGQIALVNAQLKPERARSIDLSWDHEFTPAWRSEVSVYYNRVSQAILIQMLNSDTVQNCNSGRVDYSGLDSACTANWARRAKSGLTMA